MAARYFALVPAAGNSSRMGQPKLLLPLAGQPLIWHTIKAWQRSRACAVVVVIRPTDDALAAVVQSSGAELARPAAPPPDMKASLQAALRHVQQSWSPKAADAFLIAPADMPHLSPAIIDQLIGAHAAGDGQSIIAPTLAGQRGHPVLFPWRFAAEVLALPAEEGVDSLVRRHPPRLIASDHLALPGHRPFADIDTPADYDRLQPRPDSASDDRAPGAGTNASD